MLVLVEGQQSNDEAVIYHIQEGPDIDTDLGHCCCLGAFLLGNIELSVLEYGNDVTQYDHAHFLHDVFGQVTHHPHADAIVIEHIRVRLGACEYVSECVEP